MVVILSQIKFLFSYEFIYMHNMSKLINALSRTFQLIPSTPSALSIQPTFISCTFNTYSKGVLTMPPNKDNELSIKAKVMFD
jgi:hypothetical protein